jgi:Holliday junction resolvasome RuvABC endonuclease subunit
MIKNKKILSLDVSSNTVGWALLEVSQSTVCLLDYGHLKPISKIKTDKAGHGFTFRLNYAYDQLLKLYKTHQPDTVLIEDYVRKFSEGRSSANTIIVLSTFNEVAALACFHALGFEASRLPVTTIRKNIKNKYLTAVKEKESVLEFVDKTFDVFKVKYNKLNNIKKECYDEADAIVAGIAYLIETKEI